MEERHENEQYFFDEATIATVADALSAFARPCLLCAPMVGRELHRRHRPVRILDCDERFANLPGFVKWDIYRPQHLDEQFDVIFCDPPFFNVSLSQLFAAIRLLARFDFTQRLAVTYLARRSEAILGTFTPFALRPTGFHPSYQTVQAADRNDIELFSNFDWNSGAGP